MPGTALLREISGPQIHDKLRDDGVCSIQKKKWT
jgi:hypothetical protein